ncbi:hypothetical protein CLAFUW4_13133 [Fulvia fulva]|uniref:F-box domain-containing protein n=1 Tax=Passalora fulva TaxID=5499 RepID=A0A9Q8UUV9_PASFU|nr:uncharacterized protein CLAFUR5_12992 [Fulvia fulva]KAK4611563.1 hypothetical protein CLAFUR4_13138 [Fulvia fulva]KAK4612592.1 hypothetical protein CLAFUR0_13142 [Fulvia fulva]UJO23379.1 hypothetical protein CLAFUR5_12992 [Fulvia fulva]WPV21408.1 hypothetical protein CLAFUW4_13133 [Fulvia fulva]WPV36512.1 hypothetical protein CLAFUW7_13141 [Fulvia fulva]
MEFTASTAEPVASEHPIQIVEHSEVQPAPLAEEEQSVSIEPRKSIKKVVPLDDDEPLIDTTEAIPLKSKKTERMQKRMQKKLRKTKATSDVKNFLELPSELLQAVLGYLQPGDIFGLLLLNKSTRQYIMNNQSSIARDVLNLRYWSLSRAFHKPLPLHDIDPVGQASLLNERYQEKLVIHSKYQHIPKFDEHKICTCVTCVQAWNNLCVIMDLHNFQDHLDRREAIPMILRGRFPEWNTKLLQSHAHAVEKAVESPLAYARIMQFHLDTIVRTLNRPIHIGKKTIEQKKKLYHLTASDTASGTDKFLERSGRPTYQIPFHRDNYYSLDAYVPNRKWSKEQEKWQYWQTHDIDLERTVRWFKPADFGIQPPPTAK